MRIQKKKSGIQEGDLTPMIDMTFQLIAFFMVLINFTEAEQDQRIQLPSSELAKPPEGLLESPITLQLTKDAQVIFGGEPIPIDQFKPYLQREVTVIKSQGGSPGDATLIIRAHAEAKTGEVQRLIQICQESQFEKFALRAKQEEKD